MVNRRTDGYENNNPPHRRLENQGELMTNAHKRPSGEYESLKEHAALVAAYATRFGKRIGLPKTITNAARWHDLGKSSAEFQARLEGGQPIDHSTAGAIHTQTDPEDTPLKDLVAYAIAGHHGGMPNGTTGDGPLKARLRKSEGEDIPSWSKYADPELLSGAGWETYEETLPLLGKRGNGTVWALQMLGRMIFSCLVDADFLATEEFMAGKPRNEPECGPKKMRALFHRLESHVKDVESTSPPTQLNAGRKELRLEVWGKANTDPGIKILKVPTGGGKTFLATGFGLLHNTYHNMDRVIYAAPYTTILDENAETLRRALGATDEEVTEHHHNVAPEKDTVTNRLASENWASPVVLTTHVQLFESLLANRPRKCRKLHNIAHSTIIIDEIQQIPATLIKPILASLKLMTESYGCTVILCSATQPLLTKEHCGECGMAADEWEDLAPEAEKTLFGEKPQTRTETESLGTISADTLRAQLRKEHQALCIVNSRAIARETYLALREEEGVFHLSTWMTPKDRRRKLNEIRAALKEGARCIVVSTSLIEAGVNLDFPTLYRQLTGSDSIAQAQGRCNREGRLAGKGRCYVFKLEGSYPIPEMVTKANNAEQAFRTTGSWSSPESLETYFRLAIWDQKQQHGLDKWKLTEPGRHVALSKKETPTLRVDYETFAEAKCMEENEEPVAVLTADEWEEVKAETTQGWLGRRGKMLLRENGVALTGKIREKWTQAGKIISDPETGITRLAFPEKDYDPKSGLIVTKNILPEAPF
jgi:CRISPR-associated endonuclease/helicase Cas3